jgi:peptidoglycan/LPS O-acetylase OafA/YrhL
MWTVRQPCGGFIPAVESMRGIAALAVSGLHSFVYWTHFRVPRAPDNPLPDPHEGGLIYDALFNFFIGSGASAVTLFFVISGFVLAISLNKGASTVKFISARAFRIYPAHMFIVIVWFMFAPWLFFGGGNHSVWDLFQNLALAFPTNYVPMNGPTWSLRVEIAAVPIILAAWLIRTQLGVRGLVALAAILAAISFAPDLYFGDMIGRYLFVFVLGMLAHDLIKPTSILPTRATIPLLCIAIAVDIAARPMLGYHAQASILIEAMCCTAALALIVGADNSSLMTFLHRTAVRGFGRISYSYFLIHFPVLWAFLRLAPDLPLSAVPSGLLIWAAVIMVTVPLAVASYLWIEQPGIALGRKLIEILWSGHVGHPSRPGFVDLSHLVARVTRSRRVVAQSVRHSSGHSRVAPWCARNRSKMQKHSTVTSHIRGVSIAFDRLGEFRMFDR